MLGACAEISPTTETAVNGAGQELLAPGSFRSALSGLPALELPSEMQPGEYGCIVRYLPGGPASGEFEERFHRLRGPEEVAGRLLGEGVPESETVSIRLPFTKRSARGDLMAEGLCLIPDSRVVFDYVLRRFGISESSADRTALAVADDAIADPGEPRANAVSSLVSLNSGGWDCYWDDEMGWVCPHPPIDVIVPCGPGRYYDPDLDMCLCDNGGPWWDCDAWDDPPPPGGPGGCDPMYEYCDGDPGGPGNPGDPGHPEDPSCDPEVETMIAEYTTYNVNLRPTCSDFTKSGGSTYFTWSELNGYFQDGNPHNPWGMVSSALINGLEATRANYGYPIRLSSGYRCPHGNSDVNGATNSYHTHGRAADMFSVSPRVWTEEEFDLLARAADLTNPTERLTWDRYADRHLHVAW